MEILNLGDIIFVVDEIDTDCEVQLQTISHDTCVCKRETMRNQNLKRRNNVIIMILIITEETEQISQKRNKYHNYTK